MSLALEPFDATFTRRRLLAVGGAAALAVTVGELAGVVPALGQSAAPAYLRRSSFLPLVGDRFELAPPGARGLGVRLIAVEDLGIGKRMGALAEADDAFALLFHRPSRPRLKQDVMSLRHPRLGRFQLLVSPASTGRHGQDYAAVVNRARQPGL